MKKLFFFAAAICAAVSMNAETYNFGGITADQITTDGTIGTYVMDGDTIPSVSQPADVDINCTISTLPNLVINYTQSTGKSKDNILKFAADYMQTDGKNVILTFSNVAVGSNIELLVSAKGSTASVFTAFEGCVSATGADYTVAKKEALADYEKITFMATASTVRIKETAGGYRIISAKVGGTEAVENAFVAPKATKMMVDGQMIIVRDGVKYNALGTVVE